jgi:hypothetical protein
MSRSAPGRTRRFALGEEQYEIEATVTVNPERFEGGYDAARDASAPDADMAPPAGRFIVARLDGEPVGCGALRV